MIGGGTGDELKKLAHRFGVSDRIHFLGKMNRREVLKYMDEMDVYLQVSLQEGLPRAVAEAMSRAMPVIGSRTGGIPEMIDDAYVVERKSVNGIVRILQNMTKDDMKEQARRNFNKARDYQPSTVEKKIFSFFNEISSLCTSTCSK
jgi:glycosyltransferase involved in cell wall biosynthesis